jgi:SAM-dependent methyltransferase
MSEEPWYEDEAFWHTFASSLFSPERWAGTAAEVDQILALLELHPPASVLDLPCGPGRHAIELARRGSDVTGVDRSAEYLAAARDRAGSTDTALELVQDDMRCFARDGAFDAGLNLFTSFGYFDDPREDRQVLANFRRSLRPGGKLLMELRGKETLARDFRVRDWYEKDGVMHLEERQILDDWRRIRSRWIQIDATGRREFTLVLRLYSAAELSEMLVACGFGGVRIFGDLAGAPYDHAARRLVVVATA